MRRTLILPMLILSTVALGCAGTMSAKQSEPDEKKLSTTTIVVCPDCGHSFTIGEGLSEAEKAR